MMDEKVINDLADGFAEQWEYIKNDSRYYATQLRDDIVSVANVIAKHCPDYDIDEFYDRAGYLGTHPVHTFGIGESNAAS